MQGTAVRVKLPVDRSTGNSRKKSPVHCSVVSLK
jgi:hypothetical protein